MQSRRKWVGAVEVRVSACGLCATGHEHDPPAVRSSSRALIICRVLRQADLAAPVGVHYVRRSVSVVQPILPAIELIAPHCDSYSSWCSGTSLTARSRTSVEYLFCFPITQPSHRFVSPGNPGRFSFLQRCPVFCSADRSADRRVTTRLHQVVNGTWTIDRRSNRRDGRALATLAKTGLPRRPGFLACGLSLGTMDTR